MPLLFSALGFQRRHFHRKFPPWRSASRLVIPKRSRNPLLTEREENRNNGALAFRQGTASTVPACPQSRAALAAEASLLPARLSRHPQKKWARPVKAVPARALLPKNLLRNRRGFRHLQLGFCQSAYQVSFHGGFGRVANGRQFAHQQILGAFQHFLLPER